MSKFKVSVEVGAPYPYGDLSHHDRVWKWRYEEVDDDGETLVAGISGNGEARLSVDPYDHAREVISAAVLTRARVREYTATSKVIEV